MYDDSARPLGAMCAARGHHWPLWAGTWCLQGRSAVSCPFLLLEQMPMYRVKWPRSPLPARNLSIAGIRRPDLRCAESGTMDERTVFAATW